MKVAVLVLALAAIVHADMYLHNPRQVYMCTVNNICELNWLRACTQPVCDFFSPPLLGLFHRGSNNRLDEARRDRSNANRYIFVFTRKHESTNSIKTNCYFDTAFVFICLDFSTPRTTIAVGTTWVASTTTRVRSSLSSGPISTRVATRTTTVNKSCSICAETRSAMERPPSKDGK